jgi:hypothetical protein
MLPRALFSALLASLIGSCLLTGCATPTPFERSNKPAVTACGAPVTPPAAPLLVWSREPDGVSKPLTQKRFVLIGTSSFDGVIDDLSSRHLAVIQGKKVGAAVVLLKAECAYSNWWSEWLPPWESCSWRGRRSVLASYWTKASNQDAGS